MSNTPIRAIVFTLAEPIEEPTLRQLIEWSKKITENVASPSAQELKYIQQAWGDMVEKIAVREGVPAGYLSYVLQELQLSEQQVLEQAMQDVQSI